MRQKPGLPALKMVRNGGRSPFLEVTRCQRSEIVDVLGPHAIHVSLAFLGQRPAPPCTGSGERVSYMVAVASQRYSNRISWLSKMCSMSSATACASN